MNSRFISTCYQSDNFLNTVHKLPVIGILLLIKEVKIKKDPVHREFKRAKVGERRQKVR